MRWLIAMTVLALPMLGHFPSYVSASIVPASAAPCSAPLTLALRPKSVPGPYVQNGPPAHDIPPNPVIVHLPLYPGAVSSTTPIPNDTFQNFPASYRKLSIAEIAIPAGYAVVSDWYRGSLAACGYMVNATSPVQQHGGPPFAALFFISRDGLRTVSLTFRPVSRHLTLVRYLVQVLDLPPRPAASFLHGPFVRVDVLYHSQGVVPGSIHDYRFTSNGQPTIARLVHSVNHLGRIAVSGLGSGGVVLFSETIVLSFVRNEGGIRRVTVGGVLHQVVVGRSRPLVDTNDQVLRLADRIVYARCHSAHGCS